MKNDWNNLIGRIQNHENNAPSWKSDQKSLFRIFEWSQENGIDPSGLDSVEISKFRTIIRELRLAIEKGNVQKVQQLFDWSKTQNIIDLRHKVGISIPTEIICKSSNNSGKRMIVLEFTPEQFEQIKSASRAKFSFNLLD